MLFTYTQEFKTARLETSKKTSLLYKPRTNLSTMYFAVFVFFISFPWAVSAQATNATDATCRSPCPNGSQCFTSEPQNITLSWGYGTNQMCYGETACYGEDTVDFTKGPQQIPLKFIQGDSLYFQPNVASGFKLKPFNTSKFNFDECVLTGEAVIGSLTDTLFKVPDKYIASPGIKYFVAHANNVFTCAFGLRLQVYVRSRDPCINPNDTAKGVCSGKGSCAMTGHFLTYNMSCVCCSGYEGRYCQELDSCSRSPCQNGGTCIEKDARHTDAYNCSCVPGFIGKNCQTDVNECASNPCQNNGLCLNGENKYTCLCQPDFNGYNCEVVVPDLCLPVNPCQNGGTCGRVAGSDGNRSNYTCTCLPGFTGRNCAIIITTSILPTTHLFTSLVQVATTSEFKASSAQLQSSGIQDTTAMLTTISTTSFGKSSVIAPSTMTSDLIVNPISTLTNTIASTQAQGSINSITKTTDSHAQSTLVLTPTLSETTSVYSTISALDNNSTTLVTDNITTVSITSTVTHNASINTVMQSAVSGTSPSMPIFKTKSLSSSELNIVSSIVQTVGSSALTLDSTSSQSSVDYSSSQSSVDSSSTQSSVDYSSLKPPVDSSSTQSSSQTVVLQTSKTDTISVTKSVKESLLLSSASATVQLSPSATVVTLVTTSQVEGIASTEVVATPSPSVVTTSESVAATLTQVAETSTQVAATSTQVAATSTQVAATSTQVASTLQPVTSASKHSTASDVQVASSMASSPIIAPSSVIQISKSILESSSDASTMMPSSPASSASTIELSPSKQISSSSSVSVTITTIASSASSADVIQPSSVVQQSSTVAASTASAEVSSMTPTEPLTSTITALLSSSSVAVLSSSSTGISSSSSSTALSSVTPTSSSTALSSSSSTTSSSSIEPTSTMSLVTPTSSVVPPTTKPTVPVREMTCSDNPCGTGTCVDAKDHLEVTNFTCRCSYPTFGPRCKKDYTPHFMRFGIDSYLVHKEISLSSAMNTIVIAFKTNASNGLLFFSKHVKGYRDFFQLHIAGGKLEYRFSPGDRMVVITSKDDVNTGKKVTASVTYNSVTREGSLQVNSGVTLSKRSTGALRGINLANKWYIGGVPPGILINGTPGAVTSPSLVGCISDLELNTDDVKFTEATSWYNLGECDGPCVNNPCGVNGTCIPDPDDPHDYECKCPPGYHGRHCRNVTACSGDPCNGGKCIVPDASNLANHVCLCSFGKAGISCEHDISITVPGFTMFHGYASYLEYDPPTAGNVKFDVKLQFEVDNNTAAWNDSLLVYSGQNQYLGKGDDFIALGLKHGRVLLQYNLGSGLARIESCVLDKTQTWHSVTVQRHKKEGKLSVDNCAEVRGSSEGQLSGLNLYTPLYIGGVPDLSELPIDVDFKSGFQGNIYDVAVRYSGQEQFRDLAFVQTQGKLNRVVSGSNVGNKSYDECISRNPPCLNGGQCSRHGATYTCNCTNGWRGLYCSSRSVPCVDTNPCSFGSTCREKQQSAVCDCPLGRTGKTCSQKINIQTPQFNELSYMAFTPVYIRGATSITIKFSPGTLNGLLFYTTHVITSATGDFLSITLHKGFVQARYDLGSGVGFAQSKKEVTLNKEITVQVTRTNQQGRLTVTDQVAVDFKSPGGAVGLDVKSSFYLGGVPQLSSVNPKAVEDSLALKDYTGCIAEVTVNSKTLVLTETSAQEGRNIANCPAAGAQA